MSAVADIATFGLADELGITSAIEGLTGETAAEAALKAGEIQAGATERGIEEIRAAEEMGLGFLQPFGAVGQQGIQQAGFLTDPQAQFEFLQQNPLFQAALEEAQTRTGQQAAARGRLSAGDTLQQLSKNVLLSAQPLISGQKQSIMDLLGIGTGVAGQQAGLTAVRGTNIADLIGSGAAAQAAGQVGAATAQGQGLQNLLTTGIIAGSAFSDRKLKTNIKHLGKSNGHNIYSWTWNETAKALFGLIGSSIGVIAQEVQQITPTAVTQDHGYLKVNYDLIGGL